MISDFFRRMHINVLTFREEDGQTMAEYGVVLAVITVGVVAVLLTISTSIRTAFTGVVSALTPAAP